MWGENPTTCSLCRIEAKYPSPEDLPDAEEVKLWILRFPEEDGAEFWRLLVATRLLRDAGRYVGDVCPRHLKQAETIKGEDLELGDDEAER